MCNRSRFQGMDDIGNPNAPYGSRDWCSAVRLQLDCKIREVDNRLSSLRFDLKATREGGHYSVLRRRDGELFKTWEDYCNHPRPEGLGIGAAVANALIDTTADKRFVDGSAPVLHKLVNRKPAEVPHG